jgi:hypothetical protein
MKLSRKGYKVGKGTSWRKCGESTTDALKKVGIRTDSDGANKTFRGSNEDFRSIKLFPDPRGSLNALLGVLFLLYSLRCIQCCWTGLRTL